MIKTIVKISVAATAVLLVGCATPPKPQTVKWENLEYKPQLEACTDINKKYLKSYSFMQLLQELGEREGVDFAFTPSSQDVFTEGVSFRSWEDALYWLDHQKEYEVKVYGYASKDVIKSVEIKKITPSFFEMQCDSKIVNDKGGIPESKIGKIKADVEITESLVEFAESFDFSNKYLTVERFTNDFYYHFKETTGRNLYFRFDKKSRSLYFTLTPQQTYMTPYKMRIFKNYLDANDISYVESKNKDKVSLKDNFMLWKKAQLYLSSINKYQNNIYGVKTDEGYYEISDGKYPATPLAIELITWTPYSEKEFNVYYGKESRKVVTKDRDFVFFSKDTNKKFVVRTY